MINNNLVSYECFFFLIIEFQDLIFYKSLYKKKKKGKFQTFAIGSNLLKQKERNV